MLETLSWTMASTGLLSGLISATALIFGLKKLRKKKSILEEIDSNTTFAYSGTLSQTSLVEAAQFLELGKRNGILHIYSGRRKGSISFVNGVIVDAFYRDMSGREAVLMMLGIDEGDFYFEPRYINHPKPMQESIINLAIMWESYNNPQDDESSAT